MTCKLTSHMNAFLFQLNYSRIYSLAKFSSVQKTINASEELISPVENLSYFIPRNNYECIVWENIFVSMLSSKATTVWQDRPWVSEWVI